MKTWIKIVIGLFAIGIFALFLVYKFVYNKSHPDYENIEASVNVNAKDLYEAFNANPETAAAKYNGKIIAVTGILSKVEVADTMVTAVFVFNQGDFGDEGVRCTMLSKFNEEANRLQPDGEVIIKGYCTGFNEIDVILEKCSIINQ
jgi:sulfur carrier protein ThiS